MQIVIDKEALIRLFTVAFYAICGGDYSDVKNTVIELLDKVDYTSLPEGHGDLIDRSLLSPDSDYEDGLFYAVSIGQINGAPIIIEADKESEEE